MVKLDQTEFLGRTHGFAPAAWAATQAWLLRRLRQIAKQSSVITYGELCDEMAHAGHLPLNPHGPPLADMLGQVNVIEHRQGNPLISAVVIIKGENSPGVGFWNLAEQLGLTVGSSPTQRDAFWQQSLAACYARW